MATDPVFQSLPGAAAPAMVRIHFNDRLLSVPAGSTLASALLLAGVERFRRSPVGGGARAPYCMMGVCFECLVEVDGQPSRQACLLTVRDGMTVRSQDTLPQWDGTAAQEAHHGA